MNTPKKTQSPAVAGPGDAENVSGKGEHSSHSDGAAVNPDLDAIRAQIAERVAEEGAEYRDEEDTASEGFLAGLDLEAHRASRYIQTPPPVLEWTFRDSLLTGTVGFVCGPAGAGKSTFLIQCAGAIATGLPLIGEALTPGVRGAVLSLFCEEDERVLWRRTHAIFKALCPTLTGNGAPKPLGVRGPYAAADFGGNLFLVPAAGRDVRLVKSIGGNPTASENFHALLALAGSVDDLRLVILDPLSRLYGQNENDNSLATLFCSLLEQLAKDTGASVICVHHTGKGAALDSQKKFSLNTALSADAMRGASGLTGAARWQLNVVPLPGSEARKLLNDPGANDGAYLVGRVSKKNYGPPEEMFFLRRRHGGVLEHIQAPEAIQARELESVLLEKIIAEVQRRELAGEEALTKKQLRDVFPARWKDEIPKATKTAVEAAVEAGLLDRLLFEVKRPNKMGRIFAYLSTSPDPIPGNDKDADQGKNTGQNTGQKNTGQTGQTGQNQPSGVNRLGLLDKNTGQKNTGQDALYGIQHTEIVHIKHRTESPPKGGKESCPVFLSPSLGTGREIKQ